MERLTLGWIQLGEIVGALQGLVLAIVLASQRSNRTANRLLAAFMTTMAIYLAAGPYYTTGLIRAHPHFLGISYQTVWMFGPLVYLYARAASDRSWRFTPKALVHFIPVAITTAAMMPTYLMSGAEKVATWDRWSVEGIGGVVGWLDPFKYASGIAYSMVTALYLTRHRREVEHGYSNLERVNLRWLFWLTAASGGIWVLVTALKIAQVSTAMRDGHVAIAMAILVYSIGYMGLRQPEIFRHEVAEVPVPTPAARSERAALNDSEAELLIGSLVALMDREQPWKESELTLPDLASRVNSTPHKVSAALNARVGMTFHDFVNGYRVREVQRRIRDGDARTLKMLALALDAGFSSKSAFNQVFKKHTSQTPSAFRQSVGR